MNNKYKNFKLGKDNIGHYIVRKMRSTIKYKWDPTSPLGITMTGIKGEPELYAVFKIDWYNKELFKNNEYKSYLHPVGIYEPFFPDRPWYNCDIESSLYFGSDHYFENLDEALKFASKKNRELYPETKTRNLFGSFKKLFRKNG